MSSRARLGGSVRLRVHARLFTIEAARSIARHRLRSMLAMIGITCGVATLIAVVAIGRSAKQGVMAALDGLGNNLVWIEAGSRNAAGVRTGSHGMTTLVPQDAAAIRSEAPAIAECSENVDGRIQVLWEGSNWATGFRGVSPEYLDVRAWEIARGRFFDDAETRGAATVIVIGDTVRRQLFGEIDPLGERIRIRSSLFTVIGVLVPKGQSATGQDQDDTVMMPWTAARARLLGKDITWLDDILCSAESAERIPDASAQVSALLRDRHHIATGGDDDFNIRHPEDLLKAKLDSARTVERLLMVLAALSLAIGGIGIMNVMLASVVQRTREIGIRMAIGGRASAIRSQFLGEAVMLTSVGGGLGVALGQLATPAVAGTFGWGVVMSTSTSIVAFLFSVAVGIAFGYYPASRAAGLTPIEALRVE